MNSAEIHAEQQERNMKRFGSPYYPGNNTPGEGWPISRELRAEPDAPRRRSERHDQTPDSAQPRALPPRGEQTVPDETPSTAVDEPVEEGAPAGFPEWDG